MKVGILGTGFGTYHAKLYKNIEGVEVKKIFGRNLEKLKQTGKELNLSITQNIYEIINDPEIDIVDICLPTKEHTRYIIEALEAGKHVFCETPLCYSIEDAVLIKEAEKNYGKRVFVDLFVKFAPEYQFIHQAIQSNKYGALKYLTIHRKTPPIWGPLGLDTILTDLMLHDLDLSVWFLGNPVHKTASAISGRPGESYVKASLEYDNAIIDVVASSMMPKSYPFTVGCEAIFEDGSIEHGEYFTQGNSVKYFTEYTSDGKHKINFESPDPYELAIRHVIECCKENKETILDTSSAVCSLVIALELKTIVSKN